MQTADSQGGRIEQWEGKGGAMRRGPDNADEVLWSSKSESEKEGEGRAEERAQRARRTFSLIES